MIDNMDFGEGDENDGSLLDSSQIDILHETGEGGFTAEARADISGAAGAQSDISGARSEISGPVEARPMRHISKL